EGVLSRIERRLSGEAPELGAEAEDDPPSSPSDAPDPRTSEPSSPSGQDAPARPPILAVSTLLPGQRRYFEYVGGSSSKFWHVTVDGSELVVAFGRIGTDGQVSRKAFPTSEGARAEAEKLIREKLGKGYQEVGQNEPR
ncbi:MAG TPA: WGR domain-containing protein, partial [Vicinamibacteria bacterium]|nr:WGR domain-containing protein [Vicinamibacteria bacterium]